MSTTIDKVVHLSPERAERLARLAQDRRTTEDALVERALNLLFDLADEGSAEEERRVWRTLGIKSVERVWDNEADAAYDNWRELYGIAEG